MFVHMNSKSAVLIIQVEFLVQLEISSATMDATIGGECGHDFFWYLDQLETYDVKAR